ncbi:MAG: hypothetical protein PVH84_08720, partial [Candidatus Aminicenantes bacterium]
NLEKYLQTAEVLEVEIDSIEGRTAPWSVILDDGKITRQALFKYVDRRRPTLLPDSYHYEIAAYKVSKLLGYTAVPPVVEREIKETIGSLHLFLEGCFSLSQQRRRELKPPDPSNFSDALSELAVFESLVFCERNPEDIYIQEKDWKIWRVDFSEAFEPLAELDPGNDIARCSKGMFLSLKKVDEDEVKTVLQPHLNDEEIKALLKRKDSIIDKIQLLIEEKGEDAVLF